MNKRQLKKAISTHITFAIEDVLLNDTFSDEAVDQKIDALTKLYDSSITAVNAARNLEKGKAVKAHFAQIIKNLEEGVKGITK
ncbi:MAG: hypothetical protein R2794_11655 [Chitinophagales bacterium]